jgi:ubiquinone/menaquinone biosynthesis C-methylase UbiE
MKTLWHRLLLAGQLFADPVGLFDRIAQDPWYWEGMRQWLDELGLHAGASVLEMGCGPGAPALELARRGLRVTALDRSEPMLARLSRRAQTQGLAVEIRSGDACSTDLPAGRFSAVLGASLINVVESPAALAAEAMRVVEPGGLVSFYVPTDALDRAHVLSMARARRLPPASAAVLLTWAAKSRKASPEALALLLADAGAQAVRYRAHLDGMTGSVSGRRPLSDRQNTR